METKEYNKILEDTQRGIKMGWDNAKVEWRRMALDIIYRLCLERKLITANDFTKIIKDSHIKTHDNRAIGGLVMAAKKFKWIKPTGKVEVSKAGHFIKIQVWESLICQTRGLSNTLPLL